MAFFMRVGLVAACVSCASAAPPPSNTMTKPSASPLPVVVAELPTPDASTPTPLANIVARWNDAHNRRDADALADLYAPKVDFYDADLSNADAVKRKRDALAASPDYAQSISELEMAAVDGNGGVFVRFKKTTTTKGHSTRYFGFLYVIGGRIVAEGDRDPIGEDPSTRYTYCYVPDKPNDVRVGIFKVSALEAGIAIRFSKVFADLQASNRSRVTIEIRDCAHGCSPGDFGTCKDGDVVDFFFVASLDAQPIARFVVDPITKAVSRQ